MGRGAVISKGVRYFHTLRHLKAKQLAFQAYYRGRRFFEVELCTQFVMSVPRTGRLPGFSPVILKSPSCEDGDFFFLNLRKSFGPGIHAIDWEFSEYGKLWVYNLNYFDFLLQPGMTRDTGQSLMRSFMTGLRSGFVGLEPYPISLRGINWIKFLSMHQVRSFEIDASLYAQYRILSRSLEYHLLGNHLLENGFSLLFGAFYFNETLWFVKARSILSAELNEQVLDDGAHFELSPMYHQILLDRLLDCVNLLQHNHCFEEQDVLLGLLCGKASAMLGWLRAVGFSDGSVPYVNDATAGIAPTSIDLFAYAERLGIGSGGAGEAVLGESGYRKFIGAGYECLVDVGQIGPDYMPGHAHADTFGFVVQVEGRPFLVDTGISTYEKGPVRDEERSTLSHNTVVVKGENSSDVWGGFRVGRRAGVRVLVDGESVVEAGHDGYKRFGVQHYRRWEFENSRVVIVDRVVGRQVQAEARFHFNHGLEPVLDSTVILVADGRLSFIGASHIKMVRYRQALGFNRTGEAWCAVIRFEGELETVISIG